MSVPMPRAASATAPSQPQRVRTRPPTAIRAGVKSTELLLTFVLWFLLVYEVDWFIYVRSGIPVQRIPTLLAPMIGLVILMRGGDKRAIHWPLLLFTGMHFVASLIAENAGLSRTPFKFMVYVVLLFAATVSYLDTAPKMITLLKLYLVGFIWFGLQGISDGQVNWHPLLANTDSYGPLMVISMPFSYFFALATTSTRWKWIARGTFLLSILGVVVSFARGAVLAAAVVLLYILWRSPHRTKAFTVLMLSGIVLLPAASLLIPVDAFVTEVASSTQGDDVRMTLWKLAIRVFNTSPLFGVGAGNYGVVAARILTPDEASSMWGHMYFRPPHMPHLQILAEEGLIGIVLWISMIVAFYRWNSRLHRKDTSAIWASSGGKELDLPLIARGLEGAMLGFLGTSIFYNQLYIHWFWSLLIISFVLSLVTRPTQLAVPPPPGSVSPPRRSRRGGLR